MPHRPIEYTLDCFLPPPTILGLLLIQPSSPSPILISSLNHRSLFSSPHPWSSFVSTSSLLSSSPSLSSYLSLSPSTSPTAVSFSTIILFLSLWLSDVRVFSALFQFCPCWWWFVFLCGCSVLFGWKWFVFALELGFWIRKCLC